MKATDTVPADMKLSRRELQRQVYEGESISICNDDNVDTQYKDVTIDKTAHYFAVMQLSSISLCSCEKWVECEITGDRYKVEEGYKVTLNPLEPGFCERHFYQDDFISMLNDGQIFKKTTPIQHVEYVHGVEHIYKSAYVVHTGYAISDKLPNKGDLMVIVNRIGNDVFRVCKVINVLEAEMIVTPVLGTDDCCNIIIPFNQLGSNVIISAVARATY